MINNSPRDRSFIYVSYNHVKAKLKIKNVAPFKMNSTISYSLNSSIIE